MSDYETERKAALREHRHNFWRKLRDAYWDMIGDEARNAYLRLFPDEGVARAANAKMTWYEIYLVPPEKFDEIQFPTDMVTHE